MTESVKIQASINGLQVWVRLEDLGGAVKEGADSVNAVIEVARFLCSLHEEEINTGLTLAEEHHISTSKLRRALAKTGFYTTRELKDDANYIRQSDFDADLVAFGFLTEDGKLTEKGLECGRNSPSGKVEWTHLLLLRLVEAREAALDAAANDLLND